MSYRNTFYSLSDSGWMTSEVFCTWCEKFCSIVQERPLLLIFDGHLTHISIPVILKAMEENPHITDVLQPFDVAYFGPLKRKWEAVINTRLNELCASRARLDKAAFVDNLCSVWHQGLKPSNIVTSFQSTGIFFCRPHKVP